VTYYPKKDNYHNILPKHEFKRGRLEILWRLSGSMREVNVWWVRIKPYEPHPLPWYFTPSAALFLLSTFLLCNAHTSSTPLYSALLAGIAGAAFATYSYIRHNMPPNYEEEE
jgi:hypothetical protein